MRARQRGAAAVFVAISLTAAIAALALSLDLGRLYFTHRDLQRMADMAALDASRAASGCLAEVDNPLGAATAEAIGSLQRNGGQSAYLTAGQIQLGRMVVQDGVRSFVADGAEPQDSVRVTLRRPFPPRLVPLFGAVDAQGNMSASAAAMLRPVVSLDVQTGLASLNSDILNRLLTALLGGAVSVDLLSYQGLFSANVNLEQLQLAAGLGSVESFLETEISAPEFLNIIADALDETVDVVVRTTLLALAAGAEASRTVVPGDILGVPAGETASGAFVNVGALVTALAQAANSDRLINLVLDLNLPPLTGETNITARLIERARPAVGPATLGQDGEPQTVASSAQAVIELKAPLLALPGGALVNLELYVHVAEASASVAGLNCARRGNPYSQVQVDARSSILSIGLGSLDSSGNPQPVELVNLPLLGLKIMAGGEPLADSDAGEQTLDFSGPFPSPPQTIGVSVGDTLADTLDNLGNFIPRIEGPGGVILDLADFPLVQPLIDLLVPQVAAALRVLDQAALAPLLAGLGVQTGTAEVRVESVSGDQPVLFAR